MNLKIEMSADEWLSAIFTLIVVGIILAVLMTVASAATINLDYGQCLQDNSSNDTYCAPAFIDVRLNLTINATAPVNYNNPEWNISINIPTKKYNINQTIDNGQFYTHMATNITVWATEFPSIDRTLELYGNTTWQPQDSRFNLTVNTHCMLTLDCRENVDRLLSYGANYYSDKCNIRIRAPERPSVDETRTLLSGECVTNSELGFVYCSENVTPAILQAQAEAVLLNDTIRLMQENTTKNHDQMIELNGTLNIREERIGELETDLGIATGELKGIEQGKGETDTILLAGILLCAVVLGGAYYLTNMRNKPPVNGNDDPVHHIKNEIIQEIKKHFEKKGD